MAVIDYTTEKNHQGTIVVTWVVTSPNNEGAPYDISEHQIISIQRSGDVSNLSFLFANSITTPVFNAIPLQWESGFTDSSAASPLRKIGFSWVKPLKGPSSTGSATITMLLRQ